MIFRCKFSVGISFIEIPRSYTFLLYKRPICYQQIIILHTPGIKTGVQHRFLIFYAILIF